MKTARCHIAIMGAHDGENRSLANERTKVRKKEGRQERQRIKKRSCGFRLWLLLTMFIATLGSRAADEEAFVLDQIIGSLCAHSLVPDLCSRELSGLQIPVTATPLDVVGYCLQAAAARIEEAHGLAARYAAQMGGQSSVPSQCASDCADLMLDAKAKVAAAIKMLPDAPHSLRDVKVWLSSSLSYQTACSDNFEDAPGSVQHDIGSDQAYLADVLGNALSLVHAIEGKLSSPPSRRLQSIQPYSVDKLDSDGIPSWVTVRNLRKLLQSTASAVNAVVAQDGSGNFLNVTAAIESIPIGNYSGRYVIYIKAGVYSEVFNVSSQLQNVTFIGDGVGNTIITGNRSVGSGLFNTYRTSTVGVMADGFFARDITFQNTAGPSNHQAVAMRIGGDFSVFQRCSFEGYQDTLYALAGRQFYRDCIIYGTVDFIFGNAIAIFQNCQLIARVPLDNQQNTYTAQGRKLVVDVSGYSFQKCMVTGDATLLNLTSPTRTYLGRPWKAYSRVVFMESNLGSLVNPVGWLAWNSSNPFIDTVYYGEYQNFGSGSNTSQRVNWPGVHPNMTELEATQFTVQNFIAVEPLLANLEVTYQSSL